MYQHLLLDRDGPVLRVTLNRPEVRNAFNDVLIDELHRLAMDVTAARDGVRAVVLSGAGNAFCAGGDLAWMARAVELDRAENEAEAGRMAAMFDALDRLPVALIGRVHGHALGGGSGLAAVCDIVVAADDAVFGFTEVRLGLAPAVIAPYALAKIGRSAARQLFLTGMRFGAARAREIGLAHEVVDAGRLDEAVAAAVRDVLASGPEAVAVAKQLIREVWPVGAGDAARITTGAIAARRVSEEGQEGLRAFLSKRRPRWTEGA